MRIGIVFLLYLFIWIISCKPIDDSASGLTSINVNNLDKLNSIPEIQKELNGETLNYYSVTISPQGNSPMGCSEKIETDSTKNNDNIQVITESTSICIYDLHMKFGIEKSKNLLFEGDTDIGGKDNPYKKDSDTIDVNINLKKYGTSKSIVKTTVATATTSGSTTKDVNISVNYGGSTGGDNSDNDYNDNDDPCATKIQNMKKQMSKGTYFMYCYRPLNSQVSCPSTTQTYTGWFGIRQWTETIRGRGILQNCKKDGKIHSNSIQNTKYPRYFFIYMPSGCNNVYIKEFQSDAPSVATEINSYKQSAQSCKL